MQRAFSFTQGIQKIPEREILWLTISVGIWVIKYNVIWHINPEKAMKPIPHLKKKKKGILQFPTHTFDTVYPESVLIEIREIHPVGKQGDSGIC